MENIKHKHKQGIQLFINKDLELEVRAVEIDGEGWLVGKDIVTNLAYKKNYTDVLKQHVDEEDKILINSETHHLYGDEFDYREIGQRGGWLINESGLYSLILGSELPGAKKFKRWVTKEVLPSIRKHGMYATDELLDNPDLLIAAATKLKEERAARLEAEKKVQALKPKAEFYDDVVGTKDAISMAEVAKVLGIKGLGRNNLFQLLKDKRILQTNNQPYQAYVDRGYFRVVERKWKTPDGGTKINIKTLVYQKGLDYIRKLTKEL